MMQGQFICIGMEAALRPIQTTLALPFAVRARQPVQTKVPTGAEDNAAEYCIN
jgi:hypothetical protein